MWALRSALVKIRGHRLGNECIHGKVLISHAEWGKDEKYSKITGLTWS